MRTCTKCGKELPITDFYMRDGGRRRATCRFCEIAHRRIYYRRYNAMNPELIRMWQRQGYARNRAQIIERSKRQDPEKRAVRRKLRWMVDSGQIKRPLECTRCGGKGRRIEAHHEDYARPFDVQWLCTVCHAATRRKTVIA